MTTIACILVFLCIKCHLFKNSSHIENKLNGYKITGDINGRTVHTICTYGYVPSKKTPVHTGRFTAP